MRKIHNEDARKRGCRWCADSLKPEGRKGRMRPYDECPYHELDQFESYREYLKSVKDDPVSKFLKLLG